MQRQMRAIGARTVRWPARLLGRLPALLWIWCAANLLFSFGGNWTVTIRKLYTPVTLASAKSLNDYWEAHRYVASSRGDLVVSWPLFPMGGGYAIAGVSMVADWAPPTSPRWSLAGASGWDEWPDWIAAGNGFAWHGLLVARNPALYFRNYRGIAIPWWMLTAATFPLAAWAEAVRRCRSGRRRRGLCLSCGYDLRGTPTRCPECGSPAPGNSVAVKLPANAPASQSQ